MRGASADAIRRHNLAAVLSLVHHEGATSRAELTRATGLNRSTIARIVGGLVELGLLVEPAASVARGVGRPSTGVAAHPDVAALAVLPEIDGITVALVGLGGSVIERTHRAIPYPSVEDVAAASAEVLWAWRDARPLARCVAAGVAVPGLVRPDGLVVHAPHLGWHNADVGGAVAAATGLVARAANDARLGVIAEHRFGAARGVGDVVSIHGGASGIGAGVLVGGTPLAGAAGFAGELGHMRISDATDLDTAGLAGTLESLVRRDQIDALAEGAGSPNERGGAARARLLHAEFESQATVLGQAIGSVANALGPELVLVGGFLELLLTHARPALDRGVASAALPPVAARLTIAAPALGSNHLAIGAAELAFLELLADPAAHAPALATSGTPATAV